MSTYNPAVPTGLLNLDVDYKNIQLNFQQANTSFGVDHTAFDVGTNIGFHKKVSMINSASPPLGGANLILYSRLFGGVSSLWLKNSTQDVPITGPANGMANGYTSLFGSIIFQWGSFSASNTSTFPVTFPIAFTSQVFNVQVSYQVNDSSTIRSGIEDGTVGLGGFTWIGTNTNSLKKVYWTAIGQ